MPPLLAALLMLEFQCDWRIVAAIDLNMEWTEHFTYLEFSPSMAWYCGHLGGNEHQDLGTYCWPCTGRGPLYN